MPCCFPHILRKGLDCSNPLYHEDVGVGGRNLYLIQKLREPFLEVQLVAKGSVDVPISTTYPTDLARHTNLLAGVWTESYACGAPMPLNADRLELRFFSGPNILNTARIAIDNVEIKEVDSCADVRLQMAAESPPPPPSDTGRRLQASVPHVGANPGFEAVQAPTHGIAEWVNHQMSANGERVQWYQTRGEGISRRPALVSNSFSGRRLVKAM